MWIEVGAGQAGLQTAARFRQMGIKTLVIDQTARVGDVWRNRYPTLALHTPRPQHQCESIINLLTKTDYLV